MNKKIIILFWLFILFFNVNYAKYIEKIKIVSENKIAFPIIIIEKEDRILINKIDLNSEIEFKFKIKNYDKNNSNKIEYFYTIEVDNNIESDFIEINLFNETLESKIELNNNRTEKIGVSKDKYEVEYKLIVKLKNENINGNINIKIGVIQNK